MTMRTNNPAPLQSRLHNGENILSIHSAKKHCPAWGEGRNHMDLKGTPGESKQDKRVENCSFHKT